MDSADDCYCRRLIEPLDDEDLPDHVCDQTMVDSVLAWVEQTWPGQELLYADQLVDPLAMLGAPRDDEDSRAPRDGDQAQLEPRVGMVLNWPLRYDGRWLALVIRQWVHEDPNPTLAAMLRDDPGWRGEVERYRPAYETWTQRSAGRSGWLDDWIYAPDRVRRELGLWGDHPDRGLARRLRSIEISDAPATLRHLRAVVAGRSEPLPARGLLVETKVFLRFIEWIEEDGTPYPSWEHQPNPHVAITGSLELLTGPLLKQAQAVAIRHRDWCRAVIARSRLTDRSAIRKAQAGSYRSIRPEQDDRYDYLAEALKDADKVVQAARRSGANLEGAISRHLTRVYRRVEKRRVRADLPPTPDEGWRKEAHRCIRERLR